jgi:hypothetical protein
MGLAGFDLELGIFCDCLGCSVLLLSVVLCLDFLGLAPSRPQVCACLAIANLSQREVKVSVELQTGDSSRGRSGYLHALPRVPSVVPSTNYARAHEDDATARG